MRISGGIAKGRRILTKKALHARDDRTGIRPTSAKVRQAIFNILGERITGSRFLDLYAGSGAVGIEAVSRGADRVVFVEADQIAAKNMKDFIDRFGFKDKSIVIMDKASLFLSKTEDQFDIIFVDPPYASDEIDTVLPMIDRLPVLRDEGIVIAEHSSKRTLHEITGDLMLVKRYKYGDTALTLFKKTKISGQSPERQFN